LSASRHLRWLKPVVWVVSLGPLARLGVLAATGGLSADPIAFITHSTGTWTLVFLCATLAVTPASRIFRAPWLVNIRRMLGLYAFFYATLHFSIYLVLDQFFDWAAIWKDIWKRPFITVGFAAFVLLIPLALTSTKGWIKRLGSRRWTQLHWAIYPAAVLGVIHWYWLVKADVREPLAYAAAVALLLGFRVAARATSASMQRTASPAPSLARSRSDVERRTS
jgi:sulfoxide reductase heme-binding subunit YedZ